MIEKKGDATNNQKGSTFSYTYFFHLHSYKLYRKMVNLFLEASTIYKQPKLSLYQNQFATFVIDLFNVL